MLTLARRWSQGVKHNQFGAVVTGCERQTFAVGGLVGPGSHGRPVSWTQCVRK